MQFQSPRGVLVAAAATNPIGWILLTTAGIVGLVNLGYKMYSKSKQSKQFVIDLFLDAFGEDEQTKAAIKENPGAILNKIGYPKDAFGSFHNDFVVELASRIHNLAKQGGSTQNEGDPDSVPSGSSEQEQAISFIKTIGLKMNKDGSPPTVKVIAKKIKSG